MRRPLVPLIAVIAALLAAMLARAQVREPGPTYPLWEYRTEIHRALGDRELGDGVLNALGREGWELAGVTRREIRVQDTIQTETVYVFKRSRGEAKR